MSLITDAIFVKALRSNTELMSTLADGDVYNTSITVPDVDLDKAALPYVIVSFDGMNNTDSTKDDEFEGDEDRVQVSIEVAAKTRPELGNILMAIRETIRTYFHANYGSDEDEDFALIPNDMVMNASGVQYDPVKPCFWQVLTYQCDTDID